MTTTLNVSAAPIQPFAIGGNALQMGPINMQEIVGSQGPEPLISKNPAWHMQASATTLGYQDRLGDAPGVRVACLHVIFAGWPSPGSAGLGDLSPRSGGGML